MKKKCIPRFKVCDTLISPKSCLVLHVAAGGAGCVQPVGEFSCRSTSPRSTEYQHGPVGQVVQNVADHGCQSDGWSTKSQTESNDFPLQIPNGGNSMEGAFYDASVVEDRAII